MRKEKEAVKTFYETFGWDKNGARVYKDTATYVDQRQPVQWYNQKIFRRTRNFLKPHGEYFLDAGSGPIPHSQYLQYSSGFARCVCVDFSRIALTEARSKLKQKGLYVQADLTNLPFKDGCFQAVHAAHVLYHIPEDEQEAAVLELYRTTAPGGVCVIIYSAPLIQNIRRIIANVPGLLPLCRKIGKPNLGDGERNSKQETAYPPLYYHAHPYRWFRETFPKSWDMDIRVWSCVNYAFTKAYVPNNFLGLIAMTFLFGLEMLFPHALLRLCQYPMVIIRRK